MRVVANYAVGYDNVDLEAASRRGVIVTNTPDVLTDATADLTFALLLSLSRRMNEAETLLRDGKWTGWAPGLLLGLELSGATLGVLGAGRIGCAVMARAKAFGMKLTYASPRASAAAEALGAEKVSLDDLWKGSDVLSLHCPLREETRGIVSREAISVMKPSAILINTARGGCVDHQALADALSQGHLAGVGLDVFDNEPEVPQALLDSPRTILLPHIGSATHTARTKMAELCASGIATVLAGQVPTNALNPEVATK